MNLKKLFINASVLLAGTALAVLIPVKAQAAGLISGGASRELNSSSSTLSETVGSSTTRTVTVQITEPSEVIEEEYLNLSIALFSTNPKYCNVRSGPGTEYSIVGRMYDGSVGSIIDEADETIADDEDPDDDNDQWIRIRSGAVEGYVLNSFLVTGVNAYNRLEEQTQYYAEILVSQLNVRKEASIDSSCLTYVTRGERYRIVMDNGTDPRVYLAAREVEAGDEELEDDGMDWVKIVYAEGKTGYVSADYITITEEYKTAKTIEEIREEEEAERERNLRATTSSGSASTGTSAPAENLTVVPNLSTDYATISELRMAIVNYGLQFVGNPYILGGQSLAGTDCSGFTCYVFRDFGISIARTPSGQYSSAGRSISLAEAQPGDIICYGSGGCSHVALYIGNGQIVQESNPRRGLEVNSVYFMSNIIAVKNVLD
ncbi:MAG: C40 family peptidase [Lachnospiraceae bacterium]|nr:C40 family peptidase [Lachnospiraceae bacterium]MBO7361947.1 C40 family peptidase [Lachnospiraceae bacterium]MBP5252832.1 C40 family peptidase [Lachnospiraceae bacterium]MBP5761740.1 C40 family peptidase [Lachnospiraceae bacterium]